MASKRPPIQLTELTNNLKASTGQGIGAFFSQPSPDLETQEKMSRPKKAVPPVRPVPVAPAVLPVPGKRIMRRRHPFDIYEDQYESLLELQRQERMNGEPGSMSAIVRTAL